MPCHTDPPTGEELAYVRLNGFLDEIGDPRPKKMSTYLCRSREMTISGMTAALCEWCKSHPGEVRDKSLEFQIWWRDHQAVDARHEREGQERRRRQALRESAMSKLNDDELRALGLK